MAINDYEGDATELLETYGLLRLSPQGLCKRLTFGRCMFRLSHEIHYHRCDTVPSLPPPPPQHLTNVFVIAQEKLARANPASCIISHITPVRTMLCSCAHQRLNGELSHGSQRTCTTYDWGGVLKSDG
jgi:hypothetical protein